MESYKKPVYKYCIVPMCRNTSVKTPAKVFFLVPRDKNIRRKWCKLMRRENLSDKTCLYCCEDHFDIKNDTKNYIQYETMAIQGVHVILRLKKDMLPHKFECQGKIKNEPDRKGYLKRKRLEVVQEALKKQRLDAGEETLSDNAEDIVETEKSEDVLQTNFGPGPSTSPMDISIQSVKCDKAIQVNKLVKYRSKGVNVKMCTRKIDIGLSPLLTPSTNASTSPFKSFQISNVKRKIFSVAETIDSLSVSSISSAQSSDYEPGSSSSEASFLLSDDKNKLFKNLMRSGMLTAIEKQPKMLLGLPKSSYHLIKLLSESIPAPTIDILITLKKIKLNESFCILALHFGYSQSTISRIFSKTISILAEKMKELIIWPGPSEIVKHLPISFRARYSNVVSIIDCLEIEKPSNAVHQSLTWSQYKKCNTIKYLISCTPDGLVNFISDGYGGRASDLIIVENCGYLDNLPPNVAVMADRGFKDLSHLLQSKSCTLIRPPSVFKSKPSTKEEVKQSKRIAALRIHVERVINRLREFHMLLPHACVHHDLIPVLDEVIVVACAIINMQDVLIKK